MYAPDTRNDCLFLFLIFCMLNRNNPFLDSEYETIEKPRSQLHAQLALTWEALTNRSATVTAYREIYCHVMRWSGDTNLLPTSGNYWTRLNRCQNKVLREGVRTACSEPPSLPKLRVYHRRTTVLLLNSKSITSL